MVQPKIWSGLESMLHDTYTDTIELLEELLASGEGSATDAQRAEWRAKLQHARAYRRTLEEQVESRRP